MSRRTLVYLAGATAAVVASVVAWTAEREPTAGTTTAASAPLALDGASLFRAKGCATCHTGPDSQSGFEGPPDLSDAPSWAGDRVPGLSAGEYIAQSIRDPIAVISPEFNAGSFGPTTGMPTLDVSDAEVDALVAYLLAP